MSAPKRSTSSTARAREHQSRRRGVGSQAGDENNDALNEPEDVESTPKLEKQLFRQRGRRTVQVLGRPHGVAGDAHRRAPHAAAEKAWWTNRKKTKQAWKVSLQEIKDRNYNLDIKNPYEEADDLAPPEEILAELRATEQRIGNIQDKIIRVLQEALS